MDLLCLDSRKLGGRGALLDRVWKCQNWPMNVSKDKHRKAKRKCLNPAATERSVPGEQTPGTNLRLSHINVFLTSVRQHVPLKIHRGFAKIFFLAKMFVSTSNVGENFGTNTSWCNA